MVRPGREGEVATGIPWVEPRGAAKHPAVHRSAAATLVWNYLAQNAISAEVEKLCSILDLIECANKREHLESAC